MAYANFSGREIVKALRSNNFRPVDRKGSHVKLRYEHPKTDETRIVTVPLVPADEISQDTHIDRSRHNAARLTSKHGSNGSIRTVDRGDF